MDETLKQQIIKDLSNYRSRDDILRELCFTHGFKWDEAEAILDTIENAEYDTIESRRRPMIFGVNALMAVGGLAIMIAMLFLGLGGLSISFLRLPIPYLGNLVFGVGGLGLSVRGMVGVYDTWRTTRYM